MTAFAGALLLEPGHLKAASEIAGEMNEMDWFLGFEPPEEQLREVLEGLEGPSRVTCMWGNSESGLSARTFLRVEDKLIEKSFIGTYIQAEILFTSWTVGRSST